MKLHSSLIMSALVALAATAPLSAAIETYTIDPVHSSVAFSVRHFVSKVPGRFTNFSGRINVDRDRIENSSIEATIETTSLDTGNKKRDDHVRSPDFLDAARYPTMTFKSKSWRKTGENTYDVTGDLTLKDVTKEVALKVALLGFGPGAGGAQLSGWEATTTIDKKDFHMIDPAMIDAALGDDVAITINVEARKT